MARPAPIISRQIEATSYNIGQLDREREIYKILSKGLSDTAKTEVFDLLYGRNGKCA